MKRYKYLQWDKDWTHGGHPDAQYIRWKENADKLKVIAPHLRKAYAVRKARHDEFISGQKNIVISLAKQVIYRLRQKLNAKDGIQI